MGALPHHRGCHSKNGSVWTPYAIKAWLALPHGWPTTMAFERLFLLILGSLHSVTFAV